jgi:hypothetical protein
LLSAPPTFPPTEVPTKAPGEAEPTVTREGEGVTFKEFEVGKLVEVHGTGGRGLRLRNRPSTSAPVHLVGLENEVFEVQGGPVVAEGYQWWFLVNPYDNEQQGWAVAAYLRQLDGP